MTKLGTELDILADALYGRELPEEFGEGWTINPTFDFCYGPIEGPPCTVNGRWYMHRVCYAFEGGRWEGFVSLIAERAAA